MVSFIVRHLRGKRDKLIEERGSCLLDVILDELLTRLADKGFKPAATSEPEPPATDDEKDAKIKALEDEILLLRQQNALLGAQAKVTPDDEQKKKDEEEAKQVAEYFKNRRV